MILVGTAARYQVVKKVAEAATFRLYICMDEATSQQYLLQIGVETGHNGGLERAAYILRELKHASDRFEAEYAKGSPGRLLNYDRLFPLVVDSFIVSEQGGRRINILAFKDVDAISEMVPLSNLLNKDRLRLDPKTDAWILGRILKLLAFTHHQGVAVRLLTTNNVLIHPDNHLAVVLDWSSAHIYQAEVPRDIRRDDIAQAAQTALAILGADPDTGTYRYETDDEGRRYVEHLWRLADRMESDAEEAHRRFYTLLDEIFGRVFHPFTTLPL